VSNSKTMKIINIALRVSSIILMLAVITLCVIVAIQPQVIRPIVLNNPMKSGWVSLVASAIVGAMVSGVTMTLFKRRIFATSLSTIETEENRRLNTELAMVQVDNISLKAKNTALRGSISSIRIKVSQGVGVVQGAFTGLENIGGGE